MYLYFNYKCKPYYIILNLQLFDYVLEQNEV